MVLQRNMKMVRFTVASVLTLLSFFRVSHTDKQLPWNIFRLAQRWPASICTVAHNECKQVPRVVNGWTIHGLWPNRKDDDDITFCNKSWHFDWSKIKVMHQELEARWPNLLSSAKYEQKLWRAEWMKHGTCATSVPETGNEYLYFKKALDLNSKFNITRALNQANIIPRCDRPFNACDIQIALRNYYQLPAFPQIRSLKFKDRPLLKSVYICMRKDFTPDTCSTWHTKCLNTTHLYLYPLHTKCSD